MRIQILSIVWIKPDEVMKINEHVKLSNQMLSIDWIILFYLFDFYFPNTQCSHQDFALGSPRAPSSEK